MKKSALDFALKFRLPLVLFVAAASFIITFYASRSERDGIGYQPEQPLSSTVAVYPHKDKHKRPHLKIPPHRQKT